MKKLINILLLASIALFGAQSRALAQTAISRGSYVNGNQITPAAPSGGDATFNTVKVADGTVSAPSYSWILDTDTGFYREGSGLVGYSSNGTLTFSFPTTTGSSGQFLTTDGAGGITWGTGSGVLPSQTGNAGKMLTTDGTNASWSSSNQISTLTQNLNTAQRTFYYVSDGATSNRASQVHAPGIVGNVAGLPATFVGMLPVPASAPSVDAYFWFLGSSTTSPGSTANTLLLRVRTGGELQLLQFGTTSSDNRSFTYSGFRTAYAGLMVSVVVVFPSGDTTTAPVVYVNGVDVSSSFSAGTAGTPPNWMPTTLDCTRFVGGLNWPAGDAPLAEYGLGAWSASEAQTYAQTGRKPSWWAAFTGSAVANYSSTFTAGVDSWTQNTGDVNLVLSAPVSGISGVNDTLQCLASGADRLFAIARSNSATNATKVRITFDYYVESGSGLAYWGLGNDADNRTDGNNVAIVEGAWTSCTLVSDPTKQKSSIALCAFTTINGSTRDTLLSGKSVYFKNVVQKQLGPVLKPVIQPSGTLGGVLRDAGSNFIAGYYTPGIVPVTTDNRGVIRYRLTWSGTHEAKAVLVDQALIPSNALVESITLTSDTSTSGSGVTVNDGDTTSYWVAATPLTANTKTYMTLANRYPASSAAADLKFQVDPDTVNFTGNIDISIQYSLTN